MYFLLKRHTLISDKPRIYMKIGNIAQFDQCNNVKIMIFQKIQYQRHNRWIYIILLCFAAQQTAGMMVWGHYVFLFYFYFFSFYKVSICTWCNYDIKKFYYHKLYLWHILLFVSICFLKVKYSIVSFMKY